MTFLEALRKAHSLFAVSGVEMVAVCRDNGPVFVVAPDELSGGSLAVTVQFHKAPLFLGELLDFEDWDAKVFRQFQRRTM